MRHYFFAVFFDPRPFFELAVGPRFATNLRASFCSYRGPFLVAIVSS
jgi:hypothetical protein